MTVQNNNQVIVDPGTPIFFGADQDERILLAGTGAVAAAGGDDTVIGAAAFGTQASIFFGNKGQDYIISNGLGDRVFGGQDGDRIISNFGQAYLKGDLDDDYLFSVLGDSTLEGGDGDDTIRSNGRANIFIGGSGADYMVGALGRDGGDDTAAGGEGNDTMVTSVNGNSYLFGNEGQDYLLSRADRQIFREIDQPDDTIVFDVEPDTLLGGKGNDVMLVGSDSDVPAPVMTGDSGGDTMGVLGSDVDGAIIGGDITPSGGSTPEPGADYIFVNGGNRHLLAGNVGDDTFSLAEGFGTDGIAVAGSDITVAGGQGNDIITGSTAANARIYGDAGNDRIALSGTAAEFWGDSPTASGTDGFGDDTIIATGVGNILAGDNASATGGTNGGGDDYLVVAGGTGNTLLGFGGDDYLVGTTGNNTLSGGEGNDTYVFGPGDVVLPDTEGSNIYIAAQDDQLQNVNVRPGDDISGVGQFTIDGDQNNNETIAGGGIITGNGDDDLTITGEASGSTYTNGGDDQLAVGGIGTSGDIQLGAGDDSLRVTGTAATAGSIAGGDGADTLDFGNATEVGGTISGGAGDDLIQIPGTATAFIDAGAGADTLDITSLGDGGTVLGGDGNDIISVDNIQGGALIDGGAGDESILPSAIGSGEAITLSGGLGDDRVGYRYGADEADNSGTSTADLALNGGGGNDFLQGSPYGGDILDGGDGNDALFGGESAPSADIISEGTDLVTTGSNFGDGDRLTGGAGNDTFAISSDNEVGFAFPNPSVGTDVNTVTPGEGYIVGSSTPNWVTAIGSSATGGTGGYLSGAFNVDTLTDFDLGEDIIAIDNDAAIEGFIDGLTGAGTAIQQFSSGAGALFGVILEGTGGGAGNGTNYTDPNNVHMNGSFYESYVIQGTADEAASNDIDFGSAVFDKSTGGFYVGGTLLAVLPTSLNLNDVDINTVVSTGQNISFDQQTGLNFF